MKKMMYRKGLFLIVSLAFYACSSGEQQAEQTTEITAKPVAIDWNKLKDPIMRAIDKHYVDNTFRKGFLKYTFTDRVANKSISFTLGKIEQDSIYMLSETAVFMKVNARTDNGDSLVFDYEVSATPAKIRPDSMVYEVKSLNLRKFNQEQRYTLKKEENFWIKELIAIEQ